MLFTVEPLTCAFGALSCASRRTMSCPISAPRAARTCLAIRVSSRSPSRITAHVRRSIAALRSGWCRDILAGTAHLVGDLPCSLFADEVRTGLFLVQVNTSSNIRYTRNTISGLRARRINTVRSAVLLHGCTAIATGLNRWPLSMQQSARSPCSTHCAVKLLHGCTAGPRLDAHTTLPTQNRPGTGIACYSSIRSSGRRRSPLLQALGYTSFLTLWCMQNIWMNSILAKNFSILQCFYIQRWRSFRQNRSELFLGLIFRKIF